MTNYQIYKRHKFLCGDKKPYLTEAGALEALIDKMLDPRAYLPEELTLYVCMYCQHLHIGHEPKWSRNGKREKDNSGRKHELDVARRQAVLREKLARDHSRPPFYGTRGCDDEVSRGLSIGKGSMSGS